MLVKEATGISLCCAVCNIMCYWTSLLWHPAVFPSCLGTLPKNVCDYQIMLIVRTFKLKQSWMQGWEKHIISCFFNPFSTGDALSFTLKAFLELMEHGIVSWDVLEHKFIKTVRTPSDNFLPEASFGLQVLLLPSSLCVCPCFCVNPSLFVW